MQAKFLFKVGSIHKSKKCGKYEVTSYLSALHIRIKFLDTGFEMRTTAAALKRGYIKDKLLPSILGVACIGDGEYNSRTGETEHSVPVIYNQWRGMLVRCYNKKGAACKTKDLTVCEEWLNFQNFAGWILEQVPEFYQATIHLNKGALIYSPETVTLKITKARYFNPEFTAYSK